jgi:pimeloyl-ACP methyl ester carboxylesterase
MSETRRSLPAFVAGSCLLVLLTVVAAVPASAAGPYQVIASATSQVGPLTRTELTVQAGASPIDNFKAIRLARESEGAHRAAILFLPPLGTSFSFYEQRDRSGGVGTSIAEFFALRGYDVYGLSPRFEGIPAGTCEAGVVDCSAMVGWDLQSMVDDTAFVRGWIGQLSPGVPVVTGGASLGGILALAVANAAPADYAGLIVWEGMLESPDPAVQALNQGYCAALEAQLAGGLIYDGVGGNVLRQVTRFAEQTPGGITPIPLFPPIFTNHQVLVLTLSTPTPGPATMPVPDYLLMNGSLAEDRLFYASEERVFENVSRFNNYVPNALVRDISCSLAGLDDQHVANLAAYTGSVIAIGGGHGFGPYLPDQLAELGSTDVTFLLEEDFGHIDHFMTPRHRQVVELPILRWLQHLAP